MMVTADSVELVGRYSKLATLPILPDTITAYSMRTAQRGQSEPRVHKIERRPEPAVIAKLVADYTAGIPTTQLTKNYALGKGTVLELLRDHDVKVRRQRITPEEIKRATGLYASGWSLAKIGTELGRDASVIWRALKKHGVELRPRNGWKD